MDLDDVILGIKIIKHSQEIMLTQSHYVESVLKKFNKYTCVSTKTPYDVSSHLRKY